MEEEIFYDFDELDDLAANYTNVVKKLEQLINQHDKVLSTFKESYDGKAKIIMEEIDKPLRNHLELLKMSYEYGKVFIEMAENRMDAADSAVSSDW